MVLSVDKMHIICGIMSIVSDIERYNSDRNGGNIFFEEVGH